MNNVSLVGRLTRDPELRYLPGEGRAVANFTLAVDKGLSKEKKAEFEAANKPTADFIRITVWGKAAENCANYLVKGRLASVEGRIETGSYDAEDGTKRYTTDINARSVQFLEWGDKEGNNAGSTSVEIDGFMPSNTDDIPF